MSRLRQLVGELHVDVRDPDHAADVLAAADLRGIDSHGIARLHAYFEMLVGKVINPR